MVWMTYEHIESLTIKNISKPGEVNEHCKDMGW